MSKNTSFIVGAELEHFIDQHVRSGQYATASEVVRAGLRALEAEETRTGALLAAIDEGRAVSCGPALDFALEQDEPHTSDLCQAAWWLERVSHDAQSQIASETSTQAAVRVLALSSRADACSRVATWLEMRSRRRLLLLRLQVEEAEREDSTSAAPTE